MPYELIARSAGVSSVKNTTSHPAATSARTSRKVADERRSAGKAGAIIGTNTKYGEPMIVGDCVTNANAPEVAARKISAGPGSVVPCEATNRSTASTAMSMSYAPMKKPRNGFTSRRDAA